MMSNGRSTGIQSKLVALLVGATSLSALAAACGGGGGATSTSAGGHVTDAGTGPDGTFELSDEGGGSFVPEDAEPTGPLTITPANPVVQVLVDSAGVHVAPVDFAAQLGTQPVSVAWALNVGELGTLDASAGTFVASGQSAGVGTVTASVGGMIASTMVTVQIRNVQNGGTQVDGGTVDAGVGGVGGVGGNGLGGAVSPTLVSLLTGAGPAGDGGVDAGAIDAGSAVDAGSTSAGVAWLYPYDGTVWPRGILAPLLQWTTAGTAVYIHLTENNYEFEGFYGGTNLVNQPIDQNAWAQATSSNSGDPLVVAITVTDGTHVFGPVTESWTIASGVLKGTVYYNSYNTKLATPIAGESQAAAVLAIQPGLTDPQLAIPGSGTKCLVCHTVSADGATLFASNGEVWPNYKETDAFDLQSKSGTATNVYSNSAPDGTTNDEKFLWSGLWSDGSFALQSSGHTQQSYGADTSGADTHSRTFERSDGNAVPAPGFDEQIKEAVTPAFSPDGTKVAFNFWTAQTGADAGLAQGNGHTLDLMDFACGPSGNDAGGPDAGPSCVGRTFSGLRRLYTNASASGYPAWPAWLPDSSGIVFHNTVNPGTGSVIDTWDGAQAQIWYTDVPVAGVNAQPIEMNALDGKNAAGVSYLPTNANHPNDTVLNYEPTVNPIVSGGYNWVVFTSRRMYGNVASGNPYDVGNGTYPITKKLWVAAVDQSPTPGKDPSHPAFYLPAQELDAPNMRGFWVVNPCEPDGTTCSTGDECCGGYCRQNDDGGGLACNSSKPPQGCSQEFEKCVTTTDCCNAAAGNSCINGRCASPPPK